MHTPQWRLQRALQDYLSSVTCATGLDKYNYRVVPAAGITCCVIHMARREFIRPRWSMVFHHSDPGTREEERRKVCEEIVKTPPPLAG